MKNTWYEQVSLEKIQSLASKLNSYKEKNTIL